MLHIGNCNRYVGIMRNFPRTENQVFHTCLYIEETGKVLGPKIAENDELGTNVTHTANLHTGN